MTAKPKRTVIYIHGKGGSAAEAEHYKALFPDAEVVGFNYTSYTPWEASVEFPEYFDAVTEGFDSVYLIANSLGAFLSLYSLYDKPIEKAFFISPVVNMENLICDMIKWAKTTEKELCEKKEIPTSFGETLSWEYLQWVREHPIVWNIRTEILYGSEDDLQSLKTITDFTERYGAGVTVMENGKHWFHTKEQVRFLDNWIRQTMSDNEI